MNFDDKDLAMVCILVLGVASLIVFNDASVSIITGAITAIGTLATGRKKGE